MPIYEYQCRKCHDVKEAIQKFQDPPLRKCPSCGGKLEKMMSPGAFVLKGTGWYATDYGNKANGVGKGAARGKGEEKKPECPAAGEAGAPACAGCPKAD
ncbi:MAG: zinc ribbon domain-containing protein [Candidatus Deferrimicrobiaceae bacterium]